MARILAVDPGETTGVAYLSDRDIVLVAEIYGRAQTYRYLDVILNDYRPEIVVMEKFVIAQRTLKAVHEATTPMYVAGHAEALCINRGIIYREQTPAQGKGFTSDDKLKALKLYFPSEGGHQNDAARHLVRQVIAFGLGPHREWKRQLAAALL